MRSVMAVGMMLQLAVLLADPGPAAGELASIWPPTSQPADATGQFVAAGAPTTGPADESAPAVRPAAAVEPGSELGRRVAKAQSMYQAGNMRGYGLALGEILAVDPNNITALNNLGVLGVQSKVWAQAVVYLARATRLSPNDAVAENMMLAMYLSQYDREDKHKIVREGYMGLTAAQWKERVHRILAAMCAQGEPMVRTTVEAVHRERRHVGQSLWGSRWISTAQWQANVTANEKPFTLANSLIYSIRTNEARNDGTYALGWRMQCYANLVKLLIPPFPKVLVLLDEDNNAAKELAVPDVLPGESDDASDRAELPPLMFQARRGRPVQ